MRMVGEKVDLGLSLGLGGAAETQLPRPRLDLMHSSVVLPSPSPFLAHQKAPVARPHGWCDLLAFSSPTVEGRSAPTKYSFLGGIDVNRTPAAADGERDEVEAEEAGVSSPNSTLSSMAVSSGGAGPPDEREQREEPAPGHRRSHSSTGDENEAEERAWSGGISDEEDGGEGCRKKLRLSKEQSAVLEESFKEHTALNPKRKLELAKQLNLRPRQVEVWFQNRRARTKLKQTEVDCELLKRCCDRLTEENRRLQKELQELRAFKLSPHLYGRVPPPTTLTMCPSCERLATVPNPCRSAAAAPEPPAADGGQRHQQQQHFLRQPNHPRPLPHHLRQLVHRGGVPVARAGVTAGRSAVPWPLGPLRSPAFVDAPPLR